MAPIARAKTPTIAQTKTKFMPSPYSCAATTLAKPITKWRRQIDAAEQHHQRLANRGDAEQRGQDEHRTDSKLAAVAGDQDCADKMQRQGQDERRDDPLAGCAEPAAHRAARRSNMPVRPLSEIDATRISP